MKILWTKAGGVLPLDTGGRIRSFQTLKELAKRHQITLHLFYEEFANDEHASLAGIFHRVVAIPIPRSGQNGLTYAASVARRQLAGQPYTMVKWYTPEVRTTIRELFAAERFDLAVCDFVHPAGILPWSAPCPKVLFTHNIEGEVWKRQMSITPSLVRKLSYWLEYKALTRAESRYVRMADHVLAVSEGNAEFLRRLVPAERVSVVPTGVDTEYFSPQPQAETGQPEMVFTASMDWLPNEDATLYFCREVFPLIRREVPETCFWAVGRRPSAVVKRLDDGTAIRVTGSVDDIRPYLNRAAVYVMPMRSGSGTRLKIFEAMAAGKAVVSTPMGAEGLPVTNGENILLAETPGEFAHATVRLLRDPELRRRLGCAARRLTEERFSWPAATAEFERILCSVADKKR